MKIFFLVNILVSTLCFNHKGAITAADLNKLNMVIQITEHLKLSQFEDFKNEGGDFFPRLQFVMRDRNDFEMESGDEYLEDQLK